MSTSGAAHRLYPQCKPSQCLPPQVIDVGTGAGLPGMVLAVARPSWRIVLLDTLKKRCDFLDRAAQKAGISNVTTLWSRAEDAGHKAEHREVRAMGTAILAGPVAVLLYSFAPSSLLFASSIRSCLLVKRFCLAAPLHWLHTQPCDLLSRFTHRRCRLLLPQAYDIATARAVAETRVLAELCLPFVRVGGLWLAPKGPNPQVRRAHAVSCVALRHSGDAWC